MKSLQEINKEIQFQAELQEEVDFRNKSLRKLSDEQKELSIQVEEELQDVIALESLSIKSVFVRLLGDYNKMLEKEQQEYLIAVLRHKSIVEEIELVSEEIKVLQSQMTSIEELKQLRETQLRFKEIELKKRDSKFANQIFRFEKSIALVKSKKYKFEKIKKQGEKTIESLLLILDDLGHVRKWGPSQMKGVGNHASYSKKQYIDKATSKAIRAKLLLSEFDLKISAYFKESNLNIGLTEFDDFLGLFYDHLITDWIVQEKIKSCKRHIENIIDQAKRYQMTFRSEISSLTAEQEHLNKSKQKFINDYKPM